jgi:hypothetical protein
MFLCRKTTNEIEHLPKHIKSLKMQCKAVNDKQMPNTKKTYFQQKMEEKLQEYADNV